MIVNESGERHAPTGRKRIRGSLLRLSYAKALLTLPYVFTLTSDAASIVDERGRSGAPLLAQHGTELAVGEGGDASCRVAGNTSDSQIT